MKIALAQSRSTRGDVDANIKNHCRFIESAAKKGVNLIAFPELSLTGYEPDLAEELKFAPNDPRLIPLKELATSHQMIIVVGAPIALDYGLRIGAFILYPSQEISFYTKHHLHPGESTYFVPGNYNPVIKLQSETFSLAICADITHPVHAENAYKSGASIYLSSVFITENGYEADTQLLKNYAQNYAMDVFMANFCGSSGIHVSGGKSACWDRHENVISTLNTDREGLLIATKTDEGWKGENLYV
jgi:predicted amidohydrolase